MRTVQAALAQPTRDDAGRRVHNFSPGPATLAEPVMQQIREELLNYRGLGASIMEISHRSPEFEAVLDDAVGLFRELTGLSADYCVLFVHGGGRMQFAAVPMNLVGRVASRKTLYVESGLFAATAAQSAAAFGEVQVVASSKATGFDRIPEVPPFDDDAAYLHITANNTVHGTQWRQFPDTGGVPLVADVTSELLARVVDYSRFGVAYGGMQKNVGPAGTAIVVVRKDLLGHALPSTPAPLNYTEMERAGSLVNTPCTFNIYVAKLTLQWLKEIGGITEIERRNRAKATLLYQCLDASGFYATSVRPADRSMMNVTFRLPSPRLTEQFVDQAHAEGLYALAGHRAVGGVRASLYNAMSLDGVQALVAFLREFERTQA